MKILIVGAGISGLTIARKYAEKGHEVTLLEKRNHIGGNCFDYVDENGIIVSKYGAHLFHTNDEGVWNFVRQFADWFTYEHKVLSFVDGKLVPVPVNIKTVNSLFGTDIKTEEEMKIWLEKNIKPIKDPKNSEDSALSRVGPVLYEKMFKHYTKKQWDLWPEELEASVMDRIPVRTNFDDRYFTDKYQALPSGGYTKFFQALSNHKNIKIVYNTEFNDDLKNSLEWDKLFFTGPIDQFFGKKFGKLQYRSLNFQFETLDREYFQENSVINYPQTEKFTRIVEFKYFNNCKSNKTTICKEYSSWDGEPYYPVPNQVNRDLYLRYQEEAEKLESKNIFFVGRLANYKYFNMDQAFKNALDLFEKLESN